MKISTKGLYAVRFMVFLAGHGGTEPVPLKEIAEATSISRKYLEHHYARCAHRNGRLACACRLSR